MARSNYLELEFLWKKPWYRMLAALFDVISVCLAWEATLQLRMLLNSFMVINLSRETLALHAPSALSVVIVWAGVATWLHLYGAKPHARAGEYLRSVMNATALLSVVLIAYGFFTRQVGTLGAGFHVVPMSRANLPIGMYAVRLTQHGRTLSSKVTVIR